MLLPVLRSSLPAAAPLGAEPGGRAGATDPGAEGFPAAMQALVVPCAMPQRPRALQGAREGLPRFAADAMLQHQILVNSPVPHTEADAPRLYEEAF